jgi:putative oxidoreductase
MRLPDSSALQPYGLLVLRVGFAAMLCLAHGLSKLTRFGELSGKFPDPIGVGSTPSLVLVVLAEVVAPIFVAAGLFTRAACVFPVGMMLVAGLVFHGADPWEHKELAFVYLVAFLAILLAGPGRLSLDHWLRSRRGSVAG